MLSWFPTQARPARPTCHVKISQTSKNQISTLADETVIPPRNHLCFPESTLTTARRELSLEQCLKLHRALGGVIYRLLKMHTKWRKWHHLSIKAERHRDHFFFSLRKNSPKFSTKVQVSVNAGAGYSSPGFVLSPSSFPFPAPNAGMPFLLLNSSGISPTSPFLLHLFPIPSLPQEWFDPGKVTGRSVHNCAVNEVSCSTTGLEQ